MNTYIRQIILITLFTIYSYCSYSAIAVVSLEVSCNEIEWVKLGIHNNHLVELIPNYVKKFTIDSAKKVIYTVEISKPQIINLDTYGVERDYRIYIKPLDSISIFISCDSIYYSGDCTKENRFLAVNKINKEKHTKPTNHNSDNPTSLIDELNTRTQKIIDNLNETNFSDDFIKFVQADALGYNYFCRAMKYASYARDTTTIDSLNKNIQEIVRSLFNIKQFDEARSRYYVTSVSYYTRLNTMNANLSRYAKNYFTEILNKKLDINNLLYWSEDLSEILSVANCNTAVFKAKNKQELEFAEYLIKELKIKVNKKQENAIAFIETDLENKKVKFGLNKVEDFELEDLMGNVIQFSDLFGSANEILVYTWATWCAPCRAKLPSLLETNHTERKLVVLNIWSERDDWMNSIEKMQVDSYFENLYYLDKEKSDLLKLKWAIEKLPFGLIVDKELQVKALIENTEWSKFIDTQ